MADNLFTSLRLQQFRSYEDFAVELSPKVNIIVGPNASGKTNLLEALLVLAGTPSYRVNYGDLIKKDDKWARLDGIGVNDARVVKLIKKNNLTERFYEINHKPKRRLTFNDNLPVVLFEPEHLRLLTGSPQRRRDFFDDILNKTKPIFNSLRNRYNRSLAQRNSLLKTKSRRIINNQLFAWNVRLAELAGVIVDLRLGLIDEFNQSLSEVYSQIAQSKTIVNIAYVSDISSSNYESTMLHKLETSFEQDLMRGYTSFGPHRDDITFIINQQPAGKIASRGETRTLVLCLKLLEIQLIESVRLQKPLILLDDVFSELDGVRRRAVTEYLKNRQTIITTTDADVIQKHFAQNTNLISLN